MLYTVKLGEDCSQEQYDEMMENHELDCLFPVAQDLLDQYETMYPNHKVEEVVMVVRPGPVVDKCERIVFQKRVSPHE